MHAMVGMDALIANLQQQHNQALAQQAQQHAAALAQQVQHHQEHAAALAQQQAAALAQQAQQHQEHAAALAQQAQQQAAALAQQVQQQAAALAQQAQQQAAALAQQAQQHQENAAALAQQHAAALAQQQAAALAQQAQQHQAIINRLDTLQEGQRRLPMQLQNATASLHEPLQYPPNVAVVVGQFPRTKRELLRLTAANAHVVSQALGLPALPANTLVAVRQQQIMDFLGCALRAVPPAVA